MQFAISEIADPTWRAKYAELERQFQRVARNVQSAYDLGDKSISVGFVGLDHANASVGRTSQGYGIKIASVFPYLLHGFFTRLLNDPEVMPWLPVASIADETEILRFSLAPSTLEEQQQEMLVLPSERCFAVNLLSDIAMKFIMYHELGHIIAGHFDVSTDQGGTDKIEELRLVKRCNYTTRRRWEIDADLIGAALLREFIDGMITSAKSEDADAIERAVFGPPRIAVEQCASLAMVTLYSLFRFLGETRTKLNMEGDHPDPIVRAFIIRNALVPDLIKRHGVDDNHFDQIFSARFEEFDDAMEGAGLHSAMTLTNDGIEAVNDSVAEAVRLIDCERL